MKFLKNCRSMRLNVGVRGKIFIIESVWEFAFWFCGKNLKNLRESRMCDFLLLGNSTFTIIYPDFYHCKTFGYLLKITWCMYGGGDMLELFCFFSTYGGLNKNTCQKLISPFSLFFKSCIIINYLFVILLKCKFLMCNSILLINIFSLSFKPSFFFLWMWDGYSEKVIKCEIKKQIPF